MVTVLRGGGLVVRIYKDDHLPAHVHVRGDGIAKIDLGGRNDRPRLVYTRGMSHAEARRGWRLVAENQAFLLEQWKQIHGR